MFSIFSKHIIRRISTTHLAMASKRFKFAPKDHLVWVDLEMSGLDVEKEHILEIACIVTDKELNVIAEGPDVVIHQPDEVLNNMNEWCTEHHGKSGLTKSVRESKISLEQAEQMALDFVKQHTPPGKCPLAGNSVHADKVFLNKYMPKLMEHLHYRIVDVSTVKELCKRWYRRDFGGAPQKALGHRAMDDIRESIEELRYYRKAIFKPDEVATSDNEESNENQQT